MDKHWPAGVAVRGGVWAANRQKQVRLRLLSHRYGFKNFVSEGILYFCMQGRFCLTRVRDSNIQVLDSSSDLAPCMLIIHMWNIIWFIGLISAFQRDSILTADDIPTVWLFTVVVLISNSYSVFIPWIVGFIVYTVVSQFRSPVLEDTIVLFKKKY
jgi:hypothetical protein